MSDEATVTSKELERDEKGRLLPGQESLNPGGRPTGAVSITAIIKQKLREAPPGQIRPLAELMADKILEKAYVDGNDAMLKEVWHFVDGMPNQKVDFGVDKENIGELTGFLTAMAKKAQPENVNNQPTGTDGEGAK